jgi:hypothetical protein
MRMKKSPPHISRSPSQHGRVVCAVNLRLFTADTTLFGFVALGLATAVAQKSYWVGPQTGSHIAPGFVKYGSSTPSTVQTPNEDPSLAGAIASLESRAGTVVDGRLIVWDVVSQQIRVPVATLKQQAAATKMTAGELLVANSLSGGSGKKVDEVIAMRRKSKSWADVSKQLRVDPRSIAARARAASDSLRDAQSRLARGRERRNSRMLQGGSLPGPEGAGGN